MKTNNTMKFAIHLAAISLLFLSSISYAQMSEVTGFGSNPGNLTMYLFQPTNPTANAGVVLAMHGCTQSATDFANETGWNVLAEEYGFYVIHAEQKTINNPTKCFNWFLNGDNTRNSGESESLKQMVEHVHSNYSTDQSKSFVCGLSAGGSMTTVLMACYPDVFASGGVWAGVPYLYQPGQANDDTPAEWGDKVRNAFPAYTGDYPDVFVCQGSNDGIVDASNRFKIVEQWTNVHSSNQTANSTNSAFMGNSIVEENVYLNDSETDTVALTYTIDGMGHGIAVDPGTGEFQGGMTNTASYDVNFYSTYWMAKFFGLIPNPTNSIEDLEESSIQFSFLNDGSIQLINENQSSGLTVQLIEMSGKIIYSDQFQNELLIPAEKQSNSPFVLSVTDENGNKQLTRLVRKN